MPSTNPALGLKLKFRDAERWIPVRRRQHQRVACLPGRSGAGQSRALVMVFEVDDFDGAAERIAGAGGQVIGVRDMGRSWRRAVAARSGRAGGAAFRGREAIRMSAAPLSRWHRRTGLAGAARSRGDPRVHVPLLPGHRPLPTKRPCARPTGRMRPTGMAPLRAARRASSSRRWPRLRQGGRRVHQVEQHARSNSRRCGRGREQFPGAAVVPAADPAGRPSVRPLRRPLRDAAAASGGWPRGTVVYDWIEERERAELAQADAALFGLRQPTGAPAPRDPFYAALAAFASGRASPQLSRGGAGYIPRLARRVVPKAPVFPVPARAAGHPGKKTWIRKPARSATTTTRCPTSHIPSPSPRPSTWRPSPSCSAWMRPSPRGPACSNWDAPPAAT